MTDYQNSVQKMILEIIRFFKPIAEKTNNSVLKKHIAELEALEKEIERNKQIQNNDVKGLFAKKKKAKAALAAMIFELTGSLRSFARDKENDFLYQEIDKSTSDIKRLADVDCTNYADIAISNLTKYQEELKAYSFTAEELATLNANTTEFKNLLLLPAEMRKDIKDATKRIKTLMTQSLNLLSQSIDNDMLQFATTHPDYYEKYTTLREIDDSQTTAMSIKGTVVDDKTKEPLQYTKVSVKFKAGSELANKVKTTTAKGNYQFKGIPDGKCTLTFEKNYYNTISVDSEVHSGEYTRVDVEMTKTISN